MTTDGGGGHSSEPLQEVTQTTGIPNLVIGPMLTLGNASSPFQDFKSGVGQL